MSGQLSENKEFVIQIKGLKAGKHEYDFTVDGAFFERFGNTQIFDACMSVKVILEKGGGWMNVTSYIDGSVTVECDRCLDDLELPMNFKASLSVEFAKSDDDPQSDEFLVVDPLTGELDLSQFIYDYICVNIPLQRVHEEGRCNPQMVEKLDNLSVGRVEKNESGNEKNTPFGALGELLKDKK